MADAVLIVEPDRAHAARLARPLRRAGYRVVAVDGVADALPAMVTLSPSIVLCALNLGAPGEPASTPGRALAAIRTLRRQVPVPLVAIGDAHHSRDIAAALTWGADDYLRRPVDTELLAPWVAALLRRAAGGPALQPWVLVLDPARALVLDEDAHRVTLGGRPVALPPVEYRVLEVLAETPGAAISRAGLQARVWDPALPQPSGRPLDPHISRLRSRIEVDPRRPRLVVTVRGAGYRLDLPAAI